MNLDEAKRQLLEIKHVLDLLGMPFWLREGTLLGAVRDKNFIYYDHDIDLSILASDCSPQFCENFPTFKCTTMRYALGKISNVDLSKPQVGNLRTNMMLEHYNPEYNVYLTLSPPYGDSMRTVMPVGYLDKPNYIDFLGTQFRIPCNPEEVLESIYGDWRTPDMGKNLDHHPWKPWREGWGEIDMGKYLKGVI